MVTQGLPARRSWTYGWPPRCARSATLRCATTRPLSVLAPLRCAALGWGSRLAGGRRKCGSFITLSELAWRQWLLGSTGAACGFLEALGCGHAEEDGEEKRGGNENRSAAGGQNACRPWAGGPGLGELGPACTACTGERLTPSRNQGEGHLPDAHVPRRAWGR